MFSTHVRRQGLRSIRGLRSVRILVLGVVLVMAPLLVFANPFHQSKSDVGPDVNALIKALAKVKPIATNPPIRVLHANPNTYLDLIPTLVAGDMLILDPGDYIENGLPVFDLEGTAENPIIITGPDTGPRPVILGHSNQNTVRIGRSSHVIIRNLEVDSRNLGGDPVNGQDVSHHITLENLYIHGFSDNQGTVGISTNRAPTWNWIIRKNIITDGGTGMYLGNSPGTEPFIAGTIEYNLIYDTIGYNFEIKHQIPRPDVPGMPKNQNKTIVRHNVFSKVNNASTGGRARPNLLIGHLPLSGPGQDDVYEVYGNFFYQNPSEALFQGEGNIALYNNIFVNTAGSAFPAVAIRPHNDVPRQIHVFNNTVLSAGKGISISGGDPNFTQSAIGNAVFSVLQAIQAPINRDNIVDTLDNASLYLNNPSAVIGELDLFPKGDALSGPPIEASSFMNLFTDWNLDFNSRPKRLNFRGAYSGTGNNPGWMLNRERKPAALSEPDTTPPVPPTNLQIANRIGFYLDDDIRHSHAGSWKALAP